MSDHGNGKPLSGKVAMITGGSSGIGLATAQRLLREGAKASIAATNEQRLDKAEAGLSHDHGPENVHSVVCDVTDPASVEAAFQAVVAHWGRLDILVNNAGLSLSRPLTETTIEEYDRQNAVMPRGSFLCAQQAARIMQQQGQGGDIVYIASKNGLYAGPKNVAYGAAKAAQIHQARLVAVDLAPYGIRVNVVNPDAVVRGSGQFAGPWGEQRAQAYGVELKDLGKYYAQRSLLKQEVLPEDIAAAVYVLVGPDLRKSTGLIINVDSGFAPGFVR